MTSTDYAKIYNYISSAPDLTKTNVQMRKCTIITVITTAWFKNCAFGETLAYLVQ